MNNFGTGAKKIYRFVSTRLPRRTSRLSMTKFEIAHETKTNSERTYKRTVLIRSERSQGERRDKRRAWRLYK